MYSVSVTIKTPKGEKTVTQKVRSYVGAMLRMIARIEKLTILRQALIDGAGTPAN